MPSMTWMIGGSPKEKPIFNRHARIFMRRDVFSLEAGDGCMKTCLVPREWWKILLLAQD